MVIHRRRTAVNAGSCAALLSAALIGAPAIAQTWPRGPVKMIVPTGAGSAPDVIARLVAERLGQLWSQTVIVDNRPGAGGIPGMSALARSANDGYTLGFVPAAMATITPLVYKNPQFNPDTDIVPVATVGISPLLLAVPAATGITSLADLARYAREHPGKANFAAAQPNSLPHLAGEMVIKAGKLDLFTVPYPSPPAAVTAVLSGDAVLTADGLPGLLQHVKSGRLTPLAVTSEKRLPGFPDVPAVAETYPGYEAIGWFAVFVPTGVPPALAEQINRDVNKVIQAPDLVARMAEIGVYPRPGSQAAAREFVAAQRQLFKRVVSDLGLQPQ